MRTLLPLVVLAACSDYKLTAEDTTLTVRPESLALGVVELGASTEGLLTLSVTGGPVHVTGVGIEGEGFTLEDAPIGETLADGSSRAFTVRFTADAAGEYASVVSIRSDADVRGAIDVPVTVRVAEAPAFPEIDVNPLHLEVDSSSPETFIVASVGEVDLDLASIALSASSDAGFTLEGVATGLLASGDEIVVTVSYAGLGGSAEVEIASDDADEPLVVVTLNGTGSDCTVIDADGDGSNACDDCDDADAGRSPTLAEICDDAIDQDCDGADAGSVVIGLLPGWGSGTADTSLIWPKFASSWSTFGTCPVEVRDVGRDFTLATLLATGSTTLVLTDPAGGTKQYTAAELQAVRDWAEGGYGGVIYTYLMTWDGWSHAEMWDNGDIADLVGVDPAALSYANPAAVTTVAVTDPTHPVSAGLPASFPLTSYGYSQGRSTTTWADALLPGASIVMAGSDGNMVAIVHEGAVWRGVWFTGMADYQSGPASSRAMYNAAVWTGAR